MEIAAVSGFRESAATTKQMLYLRNRVREAGHGFKVFVFDDCKNKDVEGVGTSKCLAPVRLFISLMREEFDVAQIAKASPYVGLPALAACRLKQRKAVVLLDDYEGAITTKRHGKVAGSLMGLFEDLIIRFSDHVVCASKFLFDMAKGLNANCTFIPFGIPESRFENAKDIRQEIGIGLDETVYVYVGSLTSDADLDIAVKAMKHLDGKLVVVGGGEAEEHFKAMAREERVLNKVVFCGWQDFGRVPDFIQSSDICLMPMKEMDIDRARCPMKLLEYIAAEKPVVGGDVGMVSFFLEKGAGLVCRPDDPEDMAEKARKALSAEVKRLVRKADKKLKKEYSWKMTANRYLDVYKGVVG